MDEKKCGCRQCLRDRNERHSSIPSLPAEAGMMILCSTCGNKRCPHATDHRNECTNSNAPGQKGSFYE